MRERKISSPKAGKEAFSMIENRQYKQYINKTHDKTIKSNNLTIQEKEILYRPQISVYSKTQNRTAAADRRL